MNISKINKVDKVGHFQLIKPENTGKFTKKGHLHFAMIEYKRTYKGKRKLSHRALVIYFICVNDEVQKIGYTNSTLTSATSLYGKGAMTGDPGPNRFCLHLEIYKFLKKGKKVDFYCRWFDQKFEALLDGVFKNDGKENVLSFLNAVDIENYVKKKFEKSSGLPEWNLQEQSEGYSRRAKKLYGLYNSLPDIRKGSDANKLFDKIKNFYTS